MINPQFTHPKEREYFPGLNTIRAYAAFSVICSHITQNLTPPPFFATLLKPFFIDAYSAVSLFFVLSGFLITYLLLVESAKNGKVSVSKFYIRRSLRIWPLYYFIAIVGLLIFPILFGQEYILNVFYPENNLVIPVNIKIILAFCLLPNYATISAPMEHLWSIGVEEQFYGIWPWVFRNKLNIVRVCLGILIIKLSISPILPFLNSAGARRIFDEARFECMAIGALGAYVYFVSPSLLRFVYHKITQILTLCVFIFMAGREIPVNAYYTTGISIVFIVLILNTATNPSTLFKIHHPFTERLGQISYGLYLYHFPILYLFLKFTPQIVFKGVSLYPTLIFLGALVSTWLIADLSYKWFESPFLKLKERFAGI